MSARFCSWNQYRFVVYKESSKFKCLCSKKDYNEGIIQLLNKKSYKSMLPKRISIMHSRI